MAEEAVMGFSNLMDRWCTGGFDRAFEDVAYVFKPKRPPAAGSAGAAAAGQEREGREEAAPGLKTTGEEDIYQVRACISAWSSI